MKFVVNIELGNAAMQTPRHVKDAIDNALTAAYRDDDASMADKENVVTVTEGSLFDANGNRVATWSAEGTLRDANGNRVGTWSIEETKVCPACGAVIEAKRHLGNWGATGNGPNICSTCGEGAKA